MASRIPTTFTVAAVIISAALYAGRPASVLHAQNPSVTINVDVNANRRAINPDIYGIAHATPAIEHA